MSFFNYISNDCNFETVKAILYITELEQDFPLKTFVQNFDKIEAAITITLKQNFFPVISKYCKRISLVHSVTDKILIRKVPSIKANLKSKWLPSRNGGDIEILPQKLERFNPTTKDVFKAALLE